MMSTQTVSLLAKDLDRVMSVSPSTSVSDHGSGGESASEVWV